jgi:hypothetical protein
MCKYIISLWADVVLLWRYRFAYLFICVCTSFLPVSSMYVCVECLCVAVSRWGCGTSFLGSQSFVCVCVCVNAIASLLFIVPRECMQRCVHACFSSGLPVTASPCVCVCLCVCDASSSFAFLSGSVEVTERVCVYPFRRSLATGSHPSSKGGTRTIRVPPVQ